MSSKKISFWSVLIALGLLIGLIPAGAAMADTPYNVWVEGKRITSLNADDVLADGGSVIYDDATKTLTLNNAELKCQRNPKDALPSSGWSYHHSAILSKTPLTVVLEGENNVTSDSTTDFTRVFGFFDTTQIVGDGSLNIDIEERLNNLTGIFCMSDMSIGGQANIKINLKNSQPSSSVYASTNGVGVTKNLTIGEKAKVETIIDSISLGEGINARAMLVVQDEAAVKCDVRGKKSNAIECENMTIKDTSKVDCVNDGTYDCSAIYCKNALRVEGQAEVNCDQKGGNANYGISAYGKITIADQAAVHSRSQGDEYNYGIQYEVTVKDEGRFVVAGSRRALSELPVLAISEKMAVKVSDDFDGANTTLWDGVTPLGGDGSPYLYVEIKELDYTIIFDENHTGAAAPVTKYTDNQLTFPADPKRVDHTFLGWNTAQDGSGNFVDENHIFTADTTLYAQWKAHSKVTFDYNYSNGPAPKVFTADANDRLAAFPEDPERSDHTFLGWNTAQDGSGQSVSASDTFAKDTTLYAQWKAHSKVTFDYNYSNGPAPKVFTADVNDQLAAFPEDPERSGYKFRGWNTAQNGSGQNVSASDTFATDTILYAQWKKKGESSEPVSVNGSVIFDYNYAGAPADFTEKTNANGKFDQLPTVKRDGYTFLGWYDNPEGNGQVASKNDVFANGDVLYAKWQANDEVIPPVEPTEPAAKMRVVMTINSHHYTVNEDERTMDTVPMIRHSRTFVPYRALAEAFGAKVTWNHAQKIVTVKDGDQTVVMQIGSKTYTVNGKSDTMDVAPFINKDNRTMIPVRFATEALGYQVDYAKANGVAKVIFTRG